MTLDENVSKFLKNINEKILLNCYNRHELIETRKLLRVQAAYIQYYLKKNNKLYGDLMIIENNKKILDDYIYIIENKISNEIVIKQPELYYLLIAYLKKLKQDNKILISENTKFITIYKNSLKTYRALDSPLNVISISMEIGDNFNKLFNHDIYSNVDKFDYIKSLVKLILEEYNDYQSSSNEESDNNQELKDDESDDLKVNVDNEVKSDLDNNIKNNIIV